MSNPAGTWKVTVATPFGDQGLTIEMVVDGEDVSGTATHEAGVYPFSGATYRDDKVKFEISITTPVNADLKVTLQTDGDRIAGKAKAGLLSFKVEGARVS